jgi:UDP-glucose 4-epimerase
MTDRILVTGAAGFIGRHLVQRLVRANPEAKIVATDIEHSPPERYAGYIGNKLRYRQGDITNDDFLSELLEESYDRIYHLAAVVGVSDYVRNPLRIAEVNIVATKKILERITDDEVRFVFTSTSEVYGKNPDVPWDEEEDRVLGPPTTDRWSYSTGKGACEHMIHGLSRSERNFTATVVRPFNLYGPGQRPDFAIPAFVEKVVNGGVPEVFGDGTQTRCFTYIDDFVEGLLRASTEPVGENEVFNIGSTRETQIRDVAELVLSVTGNSDASPTYVDSEAVYGESYEDLKRRVPDVSKANRLLGWTAETSLEDGVEALYEWAKENY